MLILLLFFGIFWRRAGQTLGMQAWRIKLVTDSGDLPTWRQVTLRVLGALLSIGYQSGSGLLVALCAATSALLARSPVANISGLATESALAPNRPGKSDQARRHNSQVPPNQHAAMGTNAATSGS